MERRKSQQSTQSNSICSHCHRSIEPSRAIRKTTRYCSDCALVVRRKQSAYRETVGRLIAALPELTGRYHITRITAYQFGDRGWNAPEILSLDLPRPQSVEIGEVGAIYEGVAKEQSMQANQQYQSQLRERLSTITIEKLLPAQPIEPPCTDLQGVLASRISVNYRMRPAKPWRSFSINLIAEIQM
jgi:hypothetical protein